MNSKYIQVVKYGHNSRLYETLNWIKRESNQALVTNEYPKFTYNFEHKDSIVVFLNDEQNLVHNSIVCKNITTETVLTNGKKRLIDIYLYDNIEIADDESILFYNKNVGLIMAKPVGWSTITVFESEQTMPIIKKMKEDSKRFFQPKKYLRIYFNKN